MLIICKHENDHNWYKASSGYYKLDLWWLSRQIFKQDSLTDYIEIKIDYKIFRIIKEEDLSIYTNG